MALRRLKPSRILRAGVVVPEFEVEVPDNKESVSFDGRLGTISDAISKYLWCRTFSFSCGDDDNVIKL